MYYELNNRQKYVSVMFEFILQGTCMFRMRSNFNAYKIFSQHRRVTQLNNDADPDITKM